MFCSIASATQATDVFNLHLCVSFFFEPIYNFPGYSRIVCCLKDITFVTIQPTNCNHLVLLFHTYLLLLRAAAISYNILRIKEVAEDDFGKSSIFPLSTVRRCRLSFLNIFQYHLHKPIKAFLHFRDLN